MIIRGVVTDEESNPVPYANIYIKDTFDGTSSDQKGQFLFETSEKGWFNLPSSTCINSSCFTLASAALSLSSETTTILVGEKNDSNNDG